MRFNHYEHSRKEKIAYVAEALKQGRLEEFYEHRKPSKNFDLTKKSVKHHLPELRMPLDADFCLNKR